MKQKGMSVISAGFALRFAGIGPAVLIVCMMTLTAQPTAAGERYEPVQADPVRETWRWRSFPELKGLGLQCMAEDRAGSLWFGLDSEVRRYDGVTWTRYPEKNGPLGQRTRTFCVTRDGSIYAGTYQGISRFRDGNWKPVFPASGDMVGIVEIGCGRTGSLYDRRLSGADAGAGSRCASGDHTG